MFISTRCMEIFLYDEVADDTKNVFLIKKSQSKL